MTRLVERLVVCGCVLFGAAEAASAQRASREVVAADPALRLRVSQRAQTAPGHLTSLVRVAPEEGVRILRVVLDSEEFYRSSDIQLDGAQAPRSHFLEWGALPAGIYRVIVTVAGAGGVHTRTSQDLQVIGPTR